MTETLQQKIDSIFAENTLSDAVVQSRRGARGEHKDEVNQAIQELREEIINLIPNREMYPIEYRYAFSYVNEILSLIGEKK